MFAFVDFIDYMVNTKRKEYMYMVYMVFTTDGFFEVAIETWPEWDLTTEIPFRRSNRLSYQAMSYTRTQSQLRTATAISLFVQYHTYHFGCLPSSVATFILIEVFCR